MVDYYAFCGTPEQIVDQIEEQYHAGLRHLILWNITAFGDPDLAGFSFRALKQIKDAPAGALSTQRTAYPNRVLSHR